MEGPAASGLRRVFADNVRRARKARRLSQEALAELSGLHRTYVGSIERAERNVSLDCIERIAAALDVPPAELLGAQGHVSLPRGPA